MSRVAPWIPRREQPAREASSEPQGVPSRNVVEAGIAERQTAAVYLKKLVAAGVLNEVKVGREKLFTNPRLMRLLTAEAPGDLSFRARPRTKDGVGRAR